jgi:hypothetical protein
MMVKNDLLPSILATLKYTDGSTVDLTGSTIKFHLRQGTTLLFNKTAVLILPGTAGQVRYDWVSGDTAIMLDSDRIGRCKGEFEVTFPTGKVMTFPTEGDLDVIFRDEYA